jgi:hypothetical protein
MKSLRQILSLYFFNYLNVTPKIRGKNIITHLHLQSKHCLKDVNLFTRYLNSKNKEVLKFEEKLHVKKLKVNHIIFSMTWFHMDVECCTRQYI